MQTGLAVIFAYSDGLITLQPVNVLNPLVPVVRNSNVGFILPDGVEVWSAKMRFHKRGGATFADDYRLEMPNCFPGTVTVGVYESGMWAVTLTDFASSYPGEDMPITIIPLNP